MRLYFKQRFFSWLDSYDIYNEAGETVYTVEGKLAWGHKLIIFDAEGQLSWGHKLAIYNAGGEEVGMVKEVVLTFLPRFELYINGELAGTLSKELSFFRPRYNIDFNGWHVEGDFFEWDYQIEDEQGNQVASISKDLWHMTDHYAIEVNQSGDALDALMVVLAIDAEKCSRQ